MLVGAVLPGAVCAQYKKCGRRGCKCARGELHGPYFYHFKWRDGRITKKYIRLCDVDEVRAACSRYRKVQVELLEGRRHFKALRSCLQLTLGGGNDE